MSRGAPRVWTPARLAAGKLKFWSDRGLAGVATGVDGTGAASGADDSSKAAWLADLRASGIPLVQATEAAMPIVGYSPLGRGIALISEGTRRLVGGSSLSGGRYLFAAISHLGADSTILSTQPLPFSATYQASVARSGAASLDKTHLIGLAGGGSYWATGSLSGPCFVNGVETTNAGGTRIRSVVEFHHSIDATGALRLFDGDGNSNPAMCMLHQVILLDGSASSEDLANTRAYMAWHRATPVVACTIDSLTAGFQLTAWQAYPSLLHRSRWRGCVSVPNLGLVGQTVATALLNDPAKLAAVKGTGRNVVVLLGGVNDIAEGASAATVWARLKAYIAAARAQGWLVVVCSPPACPGLPEAQRNEIAALRALAAAEWNSELVQAAAYVDLYPLILVRQGDGVHFTSSDCETVANEIGAAVDELLAA